MEIESLKFMTKNLAIGVEMTLFTKTLTVVRLVVGALISVVFSRRLSSLLTKFDNFPPFQYRKNIFSLVCTLEKGTQTIVLVALICVSTTWNSFSTSSGNK